MLKHPETAVDAWGSISEHASPIDTQRRSGFGPRVRRLHSRIGRAHHQAEGMPFSRALLEGKAAPHQLAALLRSLVPVYALLEQQGPGLADRLGAKTMPWSDLARSTALAHDVAVLSSLPPSPISTAGTIWLEQLQRLAREAPHRFMAHVYVRYGGDLSGGQQLAVQVNGILRSHGLPKVIFWAFNRDIAALKLALHDGFEQMQLSTIEEQELLEEAELAFLSTQSLLAEVAELA